MFVLAPSTEEISSPQRYFLGWIQWEQHLGLKRTRKMNVWVTNQLPQGDLHYSQRLRTLMSIDNICIPLHNLDSKAILTTLPL